jgi:hypothetical protein
MVTATLLHPAQARRMAAKMPPAEHHDVQLRPLGNGDARSIIVTSAAQDFIAALFEDLQAADWRARLDSMRRRRVGSDGVLGLGQPTHRRFQIALFEAWCSRPGQPRLDPARIESSGLVVRLVRGSRRAGWMKRGKTIEGWTLLNRPELDPDPARAAAAQPANAAILSVLAARRGNPVKPAAETVHALFPAPPDVCAALGRTILFAVIPVVSTETSDLPAPGIDYRNLPAADRAAMVDHLSGYLKARSGLAMPRADEELDGDWNVLDAATMAADSRLALVGTFLHQAMVELDALGPSAASSQLMAVLREIRLPTAEDRRGRVTATVDAAEFVRRAGPILIGREANRTGFRMPLRWPTVSAALGDRLVGAALGCLTEQYKARVGPAAKFADDNARYIARGFIRVAGHDACPPKLVWSMESEPYRILPWWDGDGPAVTISLPDIRNLKKVKPSVAFAMPPAIGNLFKGDMKALAEGDGKEDNSGVAWLCSFSIPFITICAFIVLNIFLSLFDLIFRWMLFIKICIPIPKQAAPPPSGGGG